MSLSPKELADVAREIEARAALRPGALVVQKVIQPDAFTLVLGFRKGWLLLSADSRLGRIHFLDEKPPGTGEAAPPFCMLGRKHLVGQRLARARAVPGERALELVFEPARQAGEPSGTGEPRVLRLFLFGRASQLQLVGADGAQLGAIGPARRPHESLPAPRADESGSRFGAEPGLSSRIAAHYAAAAAEAATSVARRAAHDRIQAELARLERRERALAGDLARAEAAADKRKLGDLLLAHLAEVPRGAAEVTLPDDFEGGAPISIALDPARSPRANAERFYQEHKRLTRARAGIGARLDETRRAIASARAELARIASAPPEALVTVEAPSRRAPPRRGAERAAPYHEFRALTGAPILVGRGADKNDQLTFQVARGSDLWLHARDVPGAHVIVPLRASAAVDEQTLLDAATLAAYHSSARGEPQVDIGYTLRKHVRKPPKSRPGAVTTSELKTLRVRIEPERLARLLASRQRG